MWKPHNGTEAVCWYNWKKGRSCREYLFVHSFQGYVHKSQPGQCCGKCVQTHCVLEHPDYESTILIEVSRVSCKHHHVLSATLNVWYRLEITDWSPLYFWQPSETWSPSNDNCTIYDCQKLNGKLITSKNQTVCPEFDPENCIPVSIMLSWNKHIYFLLETKHPVIFICISNACQTWWVNVYC